MRRFVCLLTALLLFAVSASADSALMDKISLIKLNSCLDVLGAPKVSFDQSNESVEESAILFFLDHIYLGFMFNESGLIETGFVRAEEGVDPADFLAVCYALIWYLDDIDYLAGGQLLEQFLKIRAGGEPIAGAAGLDTFMVNKGDDVKYTFTYMNNDLKLGV